MRDPCQPKCAIYGGFGVRLALAPAVLTFFAHRGRGNPSDGFMPGALEIFALGGLGFAGSALDFITLSGLGFAGFPLDFFALGGLGFPLGFIAPGGLSFAGFSLGFIALGGYGFA